MLIEHYKHAKILIFALIVLVFLSGCNNFAKENENNNEIEKTDIPETVKTDNQDKNVLTSYEIKEFAKKWITENEIIISEEEFSTTETLSRYFSEVLNAAFPISAEMNYTEEYKIRESLSVYVQCWKFNSDFYFLTYIGDLDGYHLCDITTSGESKFLWASVWDTLRSNETFKTSIPPLETAFYPLDFSEIKLSKSGYDKTQVFPFDDEIIGVLSNNTKNGDLIINFYDASRGVFLEFFFEMHPNEQTEYEVVNSGNASFKMNIYKNGVFTNGFYFSDDDIIENNGFDSGFASVEYQEKTENLYSFFNDSEGNLLISGGNAGDGVIVIPFTGENGSGKAASRSDISYVSTENGSKIAFVENDKIYIISTETFSIQSEYAYKDPHPLKEIFFCGDKILYVRLEERFGFSNYDYTINVSGKLV